MVKDAYVPSPGRNIQMKVPLLEKIIDQFVQAQSVPHADAWHYPHAMVGHFQDHWGEIHMATLRQMYDDALRSQITQRWWKREGYRPKEIMMTLMEADTELATIAWKDLSNDAAALDGRLSRFDYYCRQLLEIYRKGHPLYTETFHHQDASIISLYLAGMQPEKYALYPGLDIFSAFCKAVGSPDIPVIDDLVRYAKITNIVYTYLQRNSGFQKVLDLRQAAHHKVKCLPYQCTYEVMHSVSPQFETRP